MSLLDGLDTTAMCMLLFATGAVASFSVLMAAVASFSVLMAFFNWAAAVQDAWERGSVRRFVLLALLPFSVPALWLLFRGCL